MVNGRLTRSQPIHEIRSLVVDYQVFSNVDTWHVRDLFYCESYIGLEPAAAQNRAPIPLLTPGEPRLTSPNM